MNAGASSTFSTVDYLREVKRLFKPHRMVDAIQEARQGTFKHIDNFCLFLGSGRCGSSLQGSLLDAHPEMVIAMEQHAVDYVHIGAPRFYVYYELLYNSRLSMVRARKTGGYTYNVPGQWQGRFTSLRVIGDKDAAHTTRMLARHYSLLPRLNRMLRRDARLKIIHTVRNPFDVVSTVARKSKVGDRTLTERVEAFFTNCQKVDTILAHLPEEAVYTSRHEDFVANPKRRLADLCGFLGVDAPADYLEACAALVHESPHRSRYQIAWDDDCRSFVQEKIGHFPWLEGYTFEN